MVIVDLSIKDAKKPPRLRFPDRCVHCSQPKVRTWPLKINTGAQKRGQMVQLEMEVPLCAECAAKENRIANVTWLPFFIVGLLTAIVVFIPVWLLTPEGPTLQTYEFPLVLGAFVGMIAGILVGTFAEFMLRRIFAPAYGSLLLKRPLTVVSVLTDAEDLIGLSVRWTKDKKLLKLTFENEQIGQEFVALNPQEN